MSVISVRLNSEEERLFDKYATFHGKSLSVMFKESLLEKIEEEFDMKLLEEAKIYNKTHPKKYSHEEMKKELGL